MTGGGDTADDVYR